MANGYTGKIARINLTTKEISTMDTSKYEEFGGGYGIGAAIFWDLAVAPGEWDLKDPFDPRHVIPIMTGPLAGTGVPGAGRTSICGISPETFPTCEFWRANFGGRFGTMMKLAGWDGVVVEGKAEKPVWINIVNDQVKIEDAKDLWGRDTWETQDKIATMVGGRTRFGDEWQKFENNTYSTSRPQIVCIGPVGEAKSRLAALITGSGVSARIGGFGAVFGAKNLKAISVVGSGTVQMADPKAVMDARLWQMTGGGLVTGSFAAAGAGSGSCNPCLRADRRRNVYRAGESMCVDQHWLANPEKQALGATQSALGASEAELASEALMKYGASGWSAHFLGLFVSDIPGAPDFFHKKVPVETGIGWYIRYLYEIGELGPGKRIDSAPLPMEQWGELSFRLAFLDAISKRIGIGDTLAEGCMRAAQKWGRLEKDLESGALRFPAWGATGHWTLPSVEWAYNYMLGAGDPSWHGLVTAVGAPRGKTLEESLTELSKKTAPYTDDIMMFNYVWKGDEAYKTGIYSMHKAKEVAWSRHYASFWNESMAFCEMFLPNLETISPEIEMKYYAAATGKKDTFADTIRVGQKIWTLERAIRVMHGRSRKTEDLAPFMYKPGASGMTFWGGVPMYENGKWRSDEAPEMYLDRKGVDQFKTHFYELEGWDKENGWPTRKTLEDFGMKRVADGMAAKGKLGA
jgi:aldehyde:ferredoxin oxidoreductase